MGKRRAIGTNGTIPPWSFRRVGEANVLEVSSVSMSEPGADTPLLCGELSGL